MVLIPRTSKSCLSFAERTQAIWKASTDWRGEVQLVWKHCAIGTWTSVTLGALQYRVVILRENHLQKGKITEVRVEIVSEKFKWIFFKWSEIPSQPKVINRICTTCRNFYWNLFFFWQYCIDVAFCGCRISVSSVTLQNPLFSFWDLVKDNNSEWIFGWKYAAATGLFWERTVMCKRTVMLRNDNLENVSAY